MVSIWNLAGLGVALLFQAEASQAFEKGGEYRGEPVRAASECVLKLTLQELGVEKREIPLPKITLANEVSLREFQDAVEPQWHLRPDTYLNVYVFHRDEIFLMSDAREYHDGRTIFDCLAHELVHYVQVKYWHYLPEYFGDSEEALAISVQTAFREKYRGRIAQDRFACPQ